MSDKLMSGLKDVATRRGFIGRSAAAAAALVAGVFGLSNTAEAVTFGCCNLCVSSSTCTGCACTWSWVCCVGTAQCPCYSCKECYRPGFACNGGCTGVYCSTGKKLNVC